MGYYFSATPCTKSEYVSELLTELSRPVTFQSKPCTAAVVDHSLRGNHLWSAIHIMSAAGKCVYSYIHLDLLVRDDDSWGHKPIDEGMGPAYYDCPLRLLKSAPLCDGPLSNADHWRANVRDWHKERKEIADRAAKLEAGQVWRMTSKYGNRTCTLIAPMPRREWAADVGGARYRVRASMLAIQL